MRLTGLRAQPFGSPRSSSVDGGPPPSIVHSVVTFSPESTHLWQSTSIPRRNARFHYEICANAAELATKVDNSSTMFKYTFQAATPENIEYTYECVFEKI